MAENNNSQRSNRGAVHPYVVVAFVAEVVVLMVINAGHIHSAAEAASTLALAVVLTLLTLVVITSAVSVLAKPLGFARRHIR